MVGLLDSGSACTILGRKGILIARKLNLHIHEVNVAIQTADGTTHLIKEAVDIPYNIENECQVVTTLLVPTIDNQAIFGIDFWIKFRIKPQFVNAPMKLINVIEIADDIVDDKAHKLTVPQQEKLDKIKDSFLTSQPDKLGLTHLIQHDIDTGDAKGVKCRTRPISPHIQKLLDLEIDRMLKMGVIERTQPTEWAHPVVCVPKKTGKLRFCLDAR